MIPGRNGFFSFPEHTCISGTFHQTVMIPSRNGFFFFLEHTCISGTFYQTVMIPGRRGFFFFPEYTENTLEEKKNLEVNDDGATKNAEQKPVYVKEDEVTLNLVKDVEICLMNFERGKYKKIHKEIAHEIKCHKCWKCFTAFKDLIDHHADIYSHIYCGVCHEKCNCTNYCTCLEKHKQTHRGPDGNFACAECSNRYFYFNHLAEHFLLHNTPTVVKGLSTDKDLRELMKSSPTEYEFNEKVSDPTQEEYPGNVVQIRELPTNLICLLD